MISNILLITALIFLSVTIWRRENRKILSLLVIAEQCLTYLLVMFIDTPSHLKIALACLYVLLFLSIRQMEGGRSIIWIAKIYLIVAMYHFLLPLEPLLIDKFFNGKATYYIHAAHFTFNILANFLIIGLVILGGVDRGSRTRFNVFNSCFWGVEHSSNTYNKITVKSKEE